MYIILMGVNVTVCCCNCHNSKEEEYGQDHTIKRLDALPELFEQ